MDFDGLLNFEKRTGVKDKELEDFLSKVDGVQAAIKGMRDGSLDPDKVRVCFLLCFEV